MRLFTRMASAAIIPGLLAAWSGLASGQVPREADDWVPSQIQPTEIPLRWSKATLEDEVKLDSYGRRPIVDREHPTWLLACERDIQLDCVESIGLVSNEGTYTPGIFVQGITRDITTRVSEGIEPFSGHATVWEIPGLIFDGRTAKLLFIGSMAGTGPIGAMGLNMDLQLHDVEWIPSTARSPRGCVQIQDGQCLIPPDYPPGTTLRVVLRTSWLAPSVVGARGTNVSLQSEDLGGGAHRWTVTGSPMLTQSRGGQAVIDSGRPSWIASAFYFSMTDPRFTDRPQPECTINQPILVSSNALELAMPQWKSRLGRLDLNMAAAHYWADGKTEWRGHYETRIPESTARCLWGIDPRLTNRVTVQVFSEDGQEKAATTAIAFDGEAVSINAYDFTFSSNIVSAKVNVKVGQRCTTPGVRIARLVCTKRGSQSVWVKVKGK